MSENRVGEKTGKARSAEVRKWLAIVPSGACTGLIMSAGALLISASNGSLFYIEDLSNPNAPPQKAPLEYVLSQVFEMLAAGLFAGALWGSIGIVLFGLPIDAWLTHIKRTRWWMYGLCGALAGVAFAALMFLTAPSPLSSPSAAQAYAIWLGAGFIAGFITATTFWLIRRPDRDAPRTNIPA